MHFCDMGTLNLVLFQGHIIHPEVGPLSLSADTAAASLWKQSEKKTSFLVRG